MNGAPRQITAIMGGKSSDSTDQWKQEVQVPTCRDAPDSLKNELSKKIKRYYMPLSGGNPTQAEQAAPDVMY